MTEAAFGLVGVVLGATVAGLVAHLTETSRWRRDQLLVLHQELAELGASKWPGDPWHETQTLIARVRVRMTLLGHDPTLLDGLDDRIRVARGSAEKVPGQELDEDDDFVWVMSSANSHAVDEHLDRITTAVTPRPRRRLPWPPAN